MGSERNGWRVVYVAGASRSGSTLFGMLVGGLPGVVWVGELWHVWERGVLANGLCGCGARFLECPFWARVGEVAFGGWRAADACRQASRRGLLARQRHLPLLALGLQSRRFRAEAEAYVGIQRQVYEAVVSVSGDRVVVDSSKSAAYGLLLRQAGIDVNPVHLVRDSRAVAYSWTRPRQTGDGGRDEHMPTFHPIWSAVIWTADNVGAELMTAKRHRRVRRLRYESLVDSPAQEIRRATCGLLPDPSGLPGRGDEAFAMGGQHSVAGNPVRMHSGHLRLALDEEWRARLGGTDWWTVTLLTSPLLARYGYSSRRPEPAEPSCRL